MKSDKACTLIYQNRTMTGFLVRAWLPAEASDLLEYGSLRSESPKRPRRGMTAKDG